MQSVYLASKSQHVVKSTVEEERQNVAVPRDSVHLPQTSSEDSELPASDEKEKLEIVREELQEQKQQLRQLKAEISEVKLERNDTGLRESVNVDRNVDHCRLHDFSAQLDVEDNRLYECVPTKVIPELKICLYPSHDDQYVSGSIRTQGAWEPGITAAIESALRKFPQATFLDIGANIGMHSLVVAKRGRTVLAVEPKRDTIKRLHKSVNINKLQDRFTLVENAVSDSRTSMTLHTPLNNQGGSTMLELRNGPHETIETILFDDLLEVFSGKEAVVKIDIEGAEAKALKMSDKFFEKVKVRVIFMEWGSWKIVVQRKEYRKVAYKEILAVIRKLTSRGFRPCQISRFLDFSADDLHFLSFHNMTKWPYDIMWVRIQ